MHRKHYADPSIPDSPEDWLGQFNTFSIYQVLPELITLWGMNVQTDIETKKIHAAEREMTTSLFLLRCVQLGISIADLDLLSIGLVNDMYAERSNYALLASHRDFDNL